MSGHTTEVCYRTS